MQHRRNRTKRRGAVIPMVAVCLVGLLGMLALAIDIGMIAVARTQAQNAADSAAMAGTRTLNGDVAANNNYAAVKPAAIKAATANSILNSAIASAQVTVDVGAYAFDATADGFVPYYTTKPAGENWTLVRAKVQTTSATAFAKVFGATTFNVSASATAVHRPRDVAIILDVGGSMRYDSLLGIPHNGNRTGSNNPETVFPKFGPYSATSTAALQRTTPTTIGSEFYNLANITVETTSGPPIVNYFFQDANATLKAFTPASDTYESTPGGDVPRKNGSSYVKTVNEMTSADKLLFNGGKGFDTNFHGYTQGPRYWGKTFFVWPPDPRSTSVTLKNGGGASAVPDWRRRFFNVSDNTKLWDSSGNWRAPIVSGTTYYTINYNEILKWIKQPMADGSTAFPPSLRAGRILYYSAIPNSITGNGATDDERFWKKYIDYVIGVYKDGSTWSVITPKTGYGDDFSWGSPTVTNSVNNDNPKRPRTRLWFGPMTMIDFLGNHNRGIDTGYEEHYWLPGTCTEAPNYACKLGIQAALQDIERNHPNDSVALMFFSNPKGSASDKAGRFNFASVPMGRNYKRLIDSLWFPTATIDGTASEVRYDDDNSVETPRAYGQTCFAMGFMLAYNQFSSNATIKAQGKGQGEYGGNGRRGANKLAIIQTDGMANEAATASWTDGGKQKSYFQLAPPNYPVTSGTVTTQIYDLVERIVADESDSMRGYSTKRKPAIIHTIAYGTMFESYSTSPNKGSSLTLLQGIQYRGNTQTSASTALADYKIITGSPSERIEKMRTAFSKIMQEGVQISLIE